MPRQTTAVTGDLQKDLWVQPDPATDHTTTMAVVSIQKDQVRLHWCCFLRLGRSMQPARSMYTVDDLMTTDL